MSDDQPQDQEFDPIFLQMVTSLQAAAMMQMGKIMNPQTGKIDRSMEHAQNTIDLLAMMKRKMAGNLSKPEQDYLDHILYELRMNFVEETENPTTPGESKDAAEGTKSEDTGEKKDDAPAPDASEQT
jgi:hypothetical protein